MDSWRVVGILCTFLCSIVSIACAAVMVLVVQDECDFLCTEDSPGAVMESEGVWSCDGTTFALTHPALLNRKSSLEHSNQSFYLSHGLLFWSFVQISSLVDIWSTASIAS